MSGRVIGLWTVLSQAGNAPRGGALWLCECACGKQRPVLGGDLRAGSSISCGCHRPNRPTKPQQPKVDRPPHPRFHGGARTRLYRVWSNMRSRCENPSNPRYPTWGGRGITICAAWKSFPAFRDWAVASGYGDNLSIERINVDGDYRPENCTWADAKAQSRNRRFVKKAPDGRAWSEIAEEHGISAAVMNGRIRAGGWPPDVAATWPLGKRRNAHQRNAHGRFEQTEAPRWRR